MRAVLIIGNIIIAVIVIIDNGGAGELRITGAADFRTRHHRSAAFAPDARKL